MQITKFIMKESVAGCGKLLPFCNNVSHETGPVRGGVTGDVTGGVLRKESFIYRPFRAVDGRCCNIPLRSCLHLAEILPTSR